MIQRFYIPGKGVCDCDTNTVYPFCNNIGSCRDCPLYDSKNSRYMSCPEFKKAYPGETAMLMGYTYLGYTDDGGEFHPVHESPNPVEFDPETLPVVRELREQLARVTAERDAAISEIESIMAYGSYDTCQFCKNTQCYARGGTKPCLPKWRGIQEAQDDE